MSPLMPRSAFALGEWGGAAAQPLEFLAVVNHVAPEVEWMSRRYFLVLGSPVYVALIMERAEPAEPKGLRGLLDR
jgi:hypothetical protein